MLNLVAYVGVSPDVPALQIVGDAQAQTLLALRENGQLVYELIATRDNEETHITNEQRGDMPDGLWPMVDNDDWTR